MVSCRRGLQEVLGSSPSKCTLGLLCHQSLSLSVSLFLILPTEVHLHTCMHSKEAQGLILKVGPRRGGYHIYIYIYIYKDSLYIAIYFVYSIRYLLKQIFFLRRYLWPRNVNYTLRFIFTCVLLSARVQIQWHVVLFMWWCW